VVDSHWVHGAHIHFVNWLWPGLTGQRVWETFANEKPKFRGALHVRYGATTADKTRAIASFVDRLGLSGSTFHPVNTSTMSSSGSTMGR
jgi:hypothetical protein